MWIRLVAICVIVGCQLADAGRAVQLQGPCNFYDTINITSGHLDQHGNFHYKGSVFNKGQFAEYNTIVENLTELVRVEPHVRGCICNLKPCIRICCFQEGLTNDPNGTCVRTETFNVPTHEGEEEIDINGRTYGVLVGRPCKGMYKLEPLEYSYDHWYFKNAIVTVDEISQSAGPSDYCFGQTFNATDDLISTDAWFCYHEDNDVRLTLYPIGMIISLPFLLITFCVYGFIPELRNLHGKSLMCYVFSLTILYISLSVVQLESETMLPAGIPCKLSGYMIYISVLLCFFWLNIMCYDIWSTFKGLRGRGSDRKRFLFYCLYAFGVPILLTAFIWLIDQLGFVPNDFKPMMGIGRCWVQKSRLVEAIYIYLPISVILIINIVLYGITAYKIYQVQKETSVIRNGESQKHSKVDADKDRFFLYLRLFIVMGATWSMEAVSWVFENTYIFYVSDLLNCLQGFIIFILFVWKKKVKKLIVRRYRSIRKLPPTASQMHSGSMRTETSRISSGVHSGVKMQGQGEKPILSQDS